MYKHFDIFLFIFLVSFDFSMCNIHWQMDSMHVGRCVCVGCQMLFRSWMLVSSIAYLKHQYIYIPYAKWTTKRKREKTPLNQKLNEIRALRTDVTLTFWHLNGRQSSLIVSFSYGQRICSGAHECTSGVASYLKIIPLYLTFSLFTFKK